MTKLLKTLLTGAVLIAGAGVASADDSFTAKFDYAPSAPVHVTYSKFKKTARKACKISRRKAGGIAMKMKIEARCKTQLVDNAVRATGMVTLIAYHEQRTGPAKTRQFASLK